MCTIFYVNRALSVFFFFFSSRRRHTRCGRDWSSDVCSSDLYAILDETDSGLDIDALKTVAHGVNSLRGPEIGILLITHYQRLLNYIIPDYVRSEERRVGKECRSRCST